MPFSSGACEVTDVYFIVRFVTIVLKNSAVIQSILKLILVSRGYHNDSEIVYCQFMQEFACVIIPVYTLINTWLGLVFCVT